LTVDRCAILRSKIAPEFWSFLGCKGSVIVHVFSLFYKILGYFVKLSIYDENYQEGNLRLTTLEWSGEALPGIS